MENMELEEITAFERKKEADDKNAETKEMIEYYTRILKETETSERFVISPKHRMMEYWDFVTLAFLTYTATITPWEMAFWTHSAAGSAMYILNRIGDAFFSCDMILNFFLIYYNNEKGREEKDQVKIIFHYLKGWFFVDLLATIPYDALFSPNSDDEGLNIFSYLRLLRILKLLRMFRVARILSRWQSRLGIRNSISSLLWCFVCAITIAHWGACVWGITPLFMMPDPGWMVYKDVGLEGPFAQYLASMYWSVMTITTIGYGDVPATNNLERFVSVGFMCFGGVLYAIIVGTICDTVTGMNVAEANFRRMMDNLNEYMSENKVPRHRRVEMRKYFLQNQPRFRHVENSVVLSNMSPGLQVKMSEICNGIWLKKIEFLKDPENPDEAKTLTIAIMQKLGLASFPSQEEIVTVGERASTLYIVKRGLVARRGFILKVSDPIGDDIILNLILDDPRRDYSVNTLTFVDLFTISRDDLLSAMEDVECPRICAKIRKLAIRMAVRLEFIAEAKRRKKAIENKKKGIAVKKAVEKKTKAKEKPNLAPPPHLAQIDDIVRLSEKIDRFLNVMRKKDKKTYPDNIKWKIKQSA